MDVNIGVSLPTVFTTLAGPYISGIALESTILGKIVENIKRPFYRHLFLGLGMFAIIFILGFLPPISTIIEKLIITYEIPKSLGDKTNAYLFVVGIGTFAVSFILLIILQTLNFIFTRKGDSDVREKPLFR